jgi:long-chain acyl-CoA synthetase
VSILITGATGFLGQHLLPLLAARHDQLLILSRDKVKAGEHFSGFAFRERITIIEGDLYKPSLGIDPVFWEQVAPGIHEIWHLAANLSFNALLRDEVLRCNLGGTLALLEKAKTCEGLERFYYVSTAFVHGNCDTLVKEDGLLPPGNISFLNSYEESKYRAEEQVRGSGLAFTIFRPAIIMGHSATGEASSMVTYFGFYNALQKAFTNGKHQAAPEEVLHIGGINGRRNHICVDHLARMMNDISLSGKDEGKTFHLAYEKQGRVDDIFAAINRCLGSNFVIHENMDRHSLNLTEVLARKFSTDYQPYIWRHDPVLDRSNTLQILGYDLSLDISLGEYLYKMYNLYGKKENQPAELK